MPVDQALYDTWEGVVSDVRRLVRGEEGLHLGDLLALSGERMSSPPRGYLDIGSMLARPRDIVLDLRELRRLERDEDAEGALASVLGAHYVREIKPSPLPRRLLRMSGEVERQEERFERKLRYLFWLN